MPMYLAAVVRQTTLMILVSREEVEEGPRVRISGAFVGSGEVEPPQLSSPHHQVHMANKSSTASLMPSTAREC